MNLKHILHEIERIDPDVYAKLDTRRTMMQRFATVGRVLTAAAVPFAFGSLFKKAYGQTTQGIVGVLNYALTLEHLEAEFYTKAVAMAPIPAGAAAGAFTTIKNHEVAHVAFLQNAIRSLNGTPVPKPNFDFSGGKGSGNGPFKDAFSNYDLLLAVSQAFEDTGVRAYKGQADKLMSNNDVLQAALQIHSVEARHAAHIRSMRRARGGALVSGTVKPWITLNQSNINAGSANGAIQPIYNGEENTMQAATIEIRNINGKTISTEAASESFDEPLTMQQVLAIVDPFIVP